MNPTGRVLRYQSSFYTVDNGEELITCTARGKLKKSQKTDYKTDIITIGDLVTYSLIEEGIGVIESVLPRKSELIRMITGIKMEYRQVLIANPDQILLVFAAAQPEPRLGMLDRFLVICERQKVPPVIVINKVDLVPEQEIRQKMIPYEKIGYRVMFTSAEIGYGIEELRTVLQGKISGLIGPSGVGKSSLINRIDPNLDLKVNEVSDFTSKGKHTTVVRQMFPLEGGGYIADMPGIKTLALWDIEPEELDGYFPEISPLVSQCLYRDCSHHPTEVGCAVHQAVEQGDVSKDRYESYLRIRYGEIEKEDLYPGIIDDDEKNAMEAD